MATYSNMFSAYGSHDNYKKFYSAAFSKFISNLNLGSVKSCLLSELATANMRFASSRDAWRTSVNLSPSSRITSLQNV